MNEHTTSAITAVILSVIGLSVIAVLVSNHAQTGSVLGAGGSTVGNMIRCALSPITGAACGTSVTSTINFGGVTIP